MAEHDSTSNPDDPDEPTAAGYITAFLHDHDQDPVDRILGEGLLGKIAVEGEPARMMDDGEMGPTVELRFHGVESGLILHVMLDAAQAIELGIRLIGKGAIAKGEI